MSGPRGRNKRGTRQSTPETLSFVELKIVCSKHPVGVLVRHCMSTVTTPGYCGRTWVMGGDARFEQRAPDYRDVAQGAPLPVKIAGQCPVHGCSESPQISVDRIHEVLRYVAENIDSDGAWQVPSTVIESMVAALRRGDFDALRGAFSSDVTQRIRGSRNS